MAHTSEEYDLELLRRDYILASESETSAVRIMAGFMVGVAAFVAAVAFMMIAQKP